MAMRTYQATMKPLAHKMLTESGVKTVAMSHAIAFDLETGFMEYPLKYAQRRR